ncbi:Mugineic-acid 3-dioxygenase [Acorus calamus]|uniref:2-oxoglutarate-dependent dioxygenase DAO n=1 Tax=Acorus calamus TaxID=4465 RepID=A0AAV9DB82_ACOCL|nr:Mugineic-acid 3-dioxygenase [Acorus calamus]
MGSAETPTQIPVFDFSSDTQTLKPGTDAWNNMSRDVCAAIARFGCFQVAYDGVPDRLREDMFEAMERVFDLPDETKRRNTSDKPYFGHNGRNEMVPMYESLGAEDASEIDKAKAFTQLLWPEGNDRFCETLNCMSKKLLELNQMIIKMIFHGFGVDHKPDAFISDGSNFRVMKYDPPSGDSTVVLPPHTDKNTLTILCQQDVVQGLEVLVDGADWVPLPPIQGCFVVLAAEMLKAWSNGRIPAAKHRVVLSPGKEQYSFGLFMLPKWDVVVKAAEELVDEAHPLRYKAFDYMDFIHYMEAHLLKMVGSNKDMVDVFAGV